MKTPDFMPGTGQVLLIRLFFPMQVTAPSLNHLKFPWQLSVCSKTTCTSTWTRFVAKVTLATGLVPG